MKIALIIVAALIAAVFIIAALIPKSHTASRSVVIRKEPRAVYDVIRDFASGPRWRPGVQKVEILTPTRFREHAKYGVVTYDIIEDDAGRLITTQIADRNLGYSGTWTYALEPVADGTRVTVTENGEIPNLMFRFMARFVFGYHATMDAYLAALQRRIG